MPDDVGRYLKADLVAELERTAKQHAEDLAQRKAIYAALCYVEPSQFREKYRADVYTRFKIDQAAANRIMEEGRMNQWPEMDY